MSATKTSLTDTAVAAAKNLPDLVANLKQIDSPLAQQIEGKPLAASRTPWGTLATGVVAWLAAKYGLGWDEQTCALVAGAATLLGGYAMRLITSAPITGLFSSGAK